MLDISTHIPFHFRSKMLGTSKGLLALLAAFLVVLNIGYLFYFSQDAGTVSEGIWKFGSSRGNYYVVDSEWLKSNTGAENFFRTSKALHANDVKKEIANHLIEDGGGEIQKIREKLKEEYTEEYKKIILADLKWKHSRDYASLHFWQMEKSYQLLEDLKARYLETHDEQLKNTIIKEVLSGTTDEALKERIEKSNSLGVDKKKYFKYIFQDLLFKFSPKEPPLSTKARGVKLHGNLYRETRKPAFSREFLTKKRVELTDAEFNELQKEHDELVREIRNLALPPSNIFQGDGIALSATGTHLPGAIAVAKQLREVGSQLKIEIMLNGEEDYDEWTCESVAPALNARCVVVEREIGPDLYKSLMELYKVEEASRFLMKSVSLLISSFDNTIALDADNFPTKLVDFLLTSEPYLSTKFILWPDAWHKGTSPLYYEIARFEVGEVANRQGWHNDKPFSDYLNMDKDKEIMLHDLAGLPSARSVESGQLVFSKKEHFRSLILSTYYTLYGEQFYFPLLYQGTFGTGDRETFVPAMHVMSETYYLTEYEMNFLGVQREYATKEGNYFDESTIVQHDPLQSMVFAKEWRKWLKSKGHDTRLNPFQEGDFTKDLVKQFTEETNQARPEALFLHIHDPKINPLLNQVTTKSRNDYKSRFLRNIGEFNEVVGTTDWELRLHAISKWLACDALSDKHIWESFKLDQKDVCKKVTQYVDFLKKDTNNVEAAELKKVYIQGQPRVQHRTLETKGLT